MNGPHLVYFADPMCSWCWGFSPVVTAIEARFGEALPIRLVLGGLRPGADRPMREKDKDETRHHWEHVHEASGQPFDFAFFEREGFVYDTEPASRAIVIMRRRGMADGLAALRRLHRAFYAESQDVTKIDVLAPLAVELGFDEAAFRADFQSQQATGETWQDFAIAQGAGVRGFPTLIAGVGGGEPYSLVTNGFQPQENILPALDLWLGRQAAA